jgi:hypothetical protein
MGMILQKHSVIGLTAITLFRPEFRIAWPSLLDHVSPHSLVAPHPKRLRGREMVYYDVGKLWKKQTKQGHMLKMLMHGFLRKNACLLIL